MRHEVEGAARSGDGVGTVSRLPGVDGKKAVVEAVLIAGDHLWEHALGWFVTGMGIEIVARSRDVSRAPELVARLGGVFPGAPRVPREM